MMRQTGGTAVGEISTRSSPFCSRERERLRRRHDAELRAGVVDDPDFPDPDAFVDPDAVVASRTAVESDNGLLRWNSERALCVAISSRADSTNSLDRASRPGRRPARVRTDTVPSAALPVADDQHVGHFLQLRLSDLISNLLLALVDVDPEPGGRAAASRTAAAYVRCRSAIGRTIAWTGASQSGKAPA